MRKPRIRIVVFVLALVTASVFFFHSSDYHSEPIPPSTPAVPHQGSQRHPPRPPAPHENAKFGSNAHNGSATSFLDFSLTDRPLTPTDDPLCAQLPGRDSKIVLIVKTGATEAFGKVPIQLQTILRCVPDVLIFSDMEQTIAGVHVRDSLDTVLDSVKEHTDFNLYRAQNACLVSQSDCTRHRDKGKEGWSMDKYKNIHIAEKAYALRPGRDWYVVIDADTYLFWTTLVAFLSRLDPERKLLLGSIAHNKHFAFAHGGSGYITSRGAMDAFVGRNPGIGNAYDKKVIEECCGDWMYSKAMSETSGIKVTQAFPTINGDKVWSLPFGPTHWCHPLATMHHVDSEEMSVFWEFEMKKHLERANAGNDAQPTPILLRDMYLEYVLPRLSNARDDWNNVSEDVIYLNPTAGKSEDKKVVPVGKQSSVEKAAHASPDGCRTACENMRDCFQYSYFYEGKCVLSKSFKIGYPTKHEEELVNRQTSGWLVDRIEAWVEKQGECKSPQWPNIK